MFGGNLDPPKYVKRTRPKPMTYDIQLPTVSCPGVYGHMARPANTDYHVQLLHYKQRVREADAHFLAAEAKRLMKDRAVARYDRHTERKVLQRHIQERFKDKVEAYDGSIEKRREKLRDLLCKEEQEFIEETIDQAQKGVDNRMQDMKSKAQLLKAQREAERMEIVNEKRIQQDIKDCTELRPVLIKKNLVDSKNTQLQQMKENQMRKEAEKELDGMWYNLMMKEAEAKMEKETQDMLKYNRAMKETIEVWEKQIEGKKVMMAEAEKVAAEDRMEIVKLQEQIRREEIEALDSKRRKRDLVAKELREQIALQEHYAAERKKAEDALNDALCRMAAAEVQREKQKIRDTTAVAKRETAIYRNHLKELEEERKLEERRLNELLEEHRKMIEKKQEEAICKLTHAREQLQKNVLAGRAEQLKYKQQEAENQLKLKEAENELIRMACETNERLQAEHERLQAEQVKQYREDLKKQIEANSEKRRLEKEQLKRELAEGLAEEERHRQHVLEIIDVRLKDQSYVHPFRRILEQPKCPCPENLIGSQN
ncbi:coiled-coil domain-containing protein 11-like [Asbolus verrucosus]|uniref:Cilia- and flagella-associated protein 53 n=1 Tax=Asbolus verrucosus TaxID=1661398 RepID=A0A482VWP6_ASBVE|nr:coiled-coil domain-containing protein 11-like [Asbolus verrucosus]